MRQRSMVVAVVFIVMMGVVGCDQIKGLLGGKKTAVPGSQNYPVKGTVIAMVNDLPITLEELNNEVAQFNERLEYMRLTDEQKRENMIDSREKKIKHLKDVMVRQRMLYQAAVDKGLDRRDDMVQILQANRIAILASEMVAEILKGIDVSPTAIEDFYNQIKDQLKESETRRVREIVVASEADAKQVLIELLQGGDFPSIARSRSIAASKENAGDLGYIARGSKGDTFPGFDEIAFSATLSTGDNSNVFKGPGGYYLIKVEGIKEGRQLALTEVSDRIKATILGNRQEEAIDKAYAEIATKTKLQYFEGEIK